jgi:DNA polymerase-3 subunit gamma/tau
MDAASRTGVDDIREIIEGVRYAPGSARFKIYIIDEVHMLSRNAFNALLKTLEEPPEHVKFVFATTEIRKVPITVLSRCQRFDLRRIETATLAEYFTDIAGREQAEIEPEAIDLISRAADGSVRDGLSLLDQAIAHGAGKTTTEQVRTMLGLADRLLVMDLFGALMGGDIQAALLNLRNQYNAGADPVTTMQDLLELTHWITQLKAVPDAADSLAAPEAERTFGADMAGKLSMPVLTRTWQMLLKGLEEVRLAPMPLSAAEMALIRLAYAADLPSPVDLVKKLQSDRPTASTPSAPAPPATATPAPVAQVPEPASEPAQEPAQETVATLAPQPTEATGGAQAQMVVQTEPERDPEPEPAAEIDPQADADAKAWGPTDFQQVLAMCREKQELRLEAELTTNVHLVSFQPGQIDLRLTDKARPNLPNVLSKMLRDWTGQNWMVMVSSEKGDQTLRDQRLAQEQALHDEVSAHPLVKSALEAFPGARITSVVEPEAPEIDETYLAEEDDEE